MRALHGILAALAVVAACKGNSPAPSAGSASPPAAMPVAAAGSAGSAAAPAVPTAPAAPAGTAKPYDGPTFSVASTLSGPDVKDKDIDTEGGKTTMTMYAFTDPGDDNVMQMVEHNPITPVGKDQVQKVLESSMQGMTENVHATVDSQKMIMVGPDPMLDFSAHFSESDGTFFMRGRVAMKNAHLYQVIAMGKGVTASPSGEGFVTSFKLK
ncbi:MAG: hypothetical protein JO257_14585 [Deltaproteobacteria bacterium]|nr:hypothetical protein [Deltaproteobacteria bacterium]